MELYTLKINVTNQRLSFGENPPEIYSGDQSIDFVEFTFTDDTWNFPNIWAIFYRQKGAAYQIALDDNKVMIPAEVMQKRGYVYIGLMATDGDSVQTSSVLQYSIRQGAANVETVTPSPSIYEQFLADLDAYQEAIHNLETLAATAETLPAGSDATASYDNGVLNLGIPKGDTGETGNGIASIQKTGTTGDVDTYTITYTNGQTTTFTVTNGDATKAFNALGINYISTTWVQGGLYNGAETVDNARIRTDSFIEFGEVLRVTCLTGYSATIHQYDAGKNYISAIPWTAGTYSVQKDENAVYFRIALSKGMGSGQPISVSESTNILFYNDFTNIGLRVQGLEEIQKGRSNQYFGEKIPSKVNSFDFSKLFSMSYGSSDSSQDLEIYDDYLFVAFSESDTIKVYSMTNYSLLATIPVSIHHGGGIQFSNDFYSNGDPFPLLYVGGWTNNLINILRITNTGGSWSATVTKTLYIPTTEGYYMAPSLDNENNIMYCYGYKNSSYQPGNGNKMKLVKCDLSQLTDNGDSTFTPLILDSIETPYMGVNQGRKYYSGRLYVEFANTSNPHNARLVAIDVNDGHTVTDIDMSRVTTSETEGLCYKIDGNDITWYYSDYFNVFEILF